METIIGTDEAGYGPNYGPLVIVGTCWEVCESGLDLREALSDVVCESVVGNDNRIAVADSKALYSSGKSLDQLELGVLSFLRQIHPACNCLVELFSQLGVLTDAHSSAESYFSLVGERCPISVDECLVANASERISSAMKAAGVHLKAVRVKCLFAEEFNSLIEHRGNKATLLSHETLTLVKELSDLSASEQLSIVCDKHGGRSKYAGLLQHCLTDSLVQIDCELPDVSRYRWREMDQRCSATFIPKGEAHLPIALASMVAKYVRERFMTAWNRFWISHLPDLRPTAGYPTDARRFRSAISEKQAELGIDDEQIWRVR